jgi:hypothetical protein
MDRSNRHLGPTKGMIYIQLPRRGLSHASDRGRRKAVVLFCIVRRLIYVKIIIVNERKIIGILTITAAAVLVIAMILVREQIFIG